MTQLKPIDTQDIKRFFDKLNTVIPKPKPLYFSEMTIKVGIECGEIKEKDGKMYFRGIEVLKSKQYYETD